MRLSFHDRVIHALLSAFKVFAYLVSALLIILVVAGILSQTPAVRDMLRSFLVSTLSKNLNGSLHIGRIDGNMVSGFTMDSVVVVQGDREVISIGRIVCFYEPFGFLRKTIDITRLVVEAPAVTLVRSPSGRWTIADLFRPSADTSAGAFDWTVRVGNVRINAGTVAVDDSTLTGGLEGAPIPLSFPASPRFTIAGIVFEGSLFLKGKDAELKIDRMRCFSTEPEFELQQLAGKVAVEAGRTRVEDLVIQSKGSYLELDASITRSILAGIPPLPELRDDSVSLRLTSRDIDYAELSRFLTWIPRGPGSASVHCEADGPFGNLRVGRLNVVTGRSNVDVHGIVARLHTPDNLYLDVTIEPSRLVLADLDIFIRQIPEEVLSADVPIALKGRFTGVPLDFATDLVIEGGFGRISGRSALHLNASPPAYSGSYDLAGFNPSMVFVGRLPGSALNGSVEIRGVDFDPWTMKTNFLLSLDSSRIGNVAFRLLRANGTMSGGTIDAEAHASSGRASAEGSFTARLSGDTISVNAADLSLASLDLADILGDTLYRSDITARGKASFSGSSPGDLDARASLTLLPSSFRGHPMETDSVSFLLDQGDPRHKILRLNSEMAEIEMNGEFDLGALPDVIDRRFGGLVRAVSSHTEPGPAAPGGRARITRAGSPEASAPPMDFTYRMNVNNILPVGKFLTTTPFNFHGELSGRFTSGRDSLSVDARGYVRELYVGTVGTGWMMKNSDVDVTISGLTDEEVLSNITADATLRAGSGFVAGSPVDNADIRLRYGREKGTFAVSGRLDSILTIALSGQVSSQPGTFVFDLDTLRATAGDYGWSNDQDVQFRLSAEGLRIMRALFRRGDEEVSARGLLARGGSLDAAFAIRKFDLSVLNVLLPYPELKTPGNGFNGTAQADVRLGGTPESPAFSIRASSENFVLKKTRLGYLESSVDYADRRLTISLQNRQTRSSPKAVLTIEGWMPADFSLTGAPERFPDLEQNITIRAEEFDISVFDPLIAELQNLTGRMNSNLVIGGTPRNPAYSGSMQFAGVNFLFAPNNLPYMMSGTIQARGSRLVLDGFTLENVPTARPAGKMQLSGTIVTDRFKLDSFDITGQGGLLIMGEETRRVLPEMYGPLFIRSDSSGLNLSGNLARPFLSGTVYVTDAFITFPPKSRQQTASGLRRLNYVVVNDTSAGYTQEEEFLLPFFAAERGMAAERGAAAGDSPGRFIDVLRYNLNVETRGAPAVRFIFSQLSDEVLYAELDGRASVVNDAGEPRIYGSIAIGAPSYYKFYQRFDATGRLKFVGPWNNPELDVRATYEASHVPTEAQSVIEGNTPRRVQVLLEITGRRYEPVLKMTLREETQNGNYVNITGNSTDTETQSDAISFILTGKFSNELTSSDRSAIAGDLTPGTGAMVGSIMASSLLTSVLDDYIRKEFPFIRSVDVTYEGGSSPGTNVQVSASALKGYLRVGGKILSDVGRASLSYKASLGDLLDANTIRNLFFQIEQRIETEGEKNTSTVEGRIYYRFSF